MPTSFSTSTTQFSSTLVKDGKQYMVQEHTSNLNGKMKVQRCGRIMNLATGRTVEKPFDQVLAVIQHGTTPAAVLSATPRVAKKRQPPRRRRTLETFASS